MKIASPAVINDVVWSFASSAFAAILGHIGDDMVAANAVAVMVVNIGAIACRGFANATTIIISQRIWETYAENNNYRKSHRMCHYSGSPPYDTGLLPG